MYSAFYSHLLGPHKKVTCSRCHREFDEDTEDMEPDDYGGMLCESCRKPTMAIAITWWEKMKSTEVKLLH